MGGSTTSTIAMTKKDVFMDSIRVMSLSPGDSVQTTEDQQLDVSLLRLLSEQQSHDESYGLLSTKLSVTAFTRWLSAAEMGNSNAMNWVGKAYETGEISAPGVYVGSLDFALQVWGQLH